MWVPGIELEASASVIAFFNLSHLASTLALEKDLKRKERNIASVVAHNYNPSTWKMEMEVQEFKVILSYVLSAKPSWTTWNPFSKLIN